MGIKQLLTSSQLSRALEEHDIRHHRTSIVRDGKAGKITVYQAGKKEYYELAEALEVYGDAPPHTTPEDMEDVDSEVIAELKAHLAQVIPGPQQVSVEKEFWLAQQAKIKYLRDVGEVIPLSEALNAIEVGVLNHKTKSYTIPNKLKTLYPNLAIEAIDTLYDLINETFEELSGIRDIKDE